MRTFPAVVIAGLCLVAALACSPSKPPVGRWEGTYESADTMIVARLEIDKDGAIYISAPDALDVAASSEAERVRIRQRLAAGLAQAWDSTPPHRFDFDGRIFRNPGGIAPQMEWNPDTADMRLIIYPGTRPVIRIKMHAVRAFSADPWPA